MTRYLIPILLVFFYSVSSSDAENTPRSVFNEGSELLGGCVLEKYNSFQESHIIKLREFIANPIGPNPSSSHPRSTGQFHNFLRDMISLCPEERYFSALQTSRRLLGKEYVSSEELEYFGELSASHVISVMILHFGE